MRADVRFRVSVAGAELRMLVLAAEARGCIGVDIDSGAFVRADLAPGHNSKPDLTMLDVAAASVGEPLDPPDQLRPEAVALRSAPTLVGRMGRRRAGRLLHPLVHPPQLPLFGFAGPCTPYWTLGGDRPSVALLAPERGPELRRVSEGNEAPEWECFFTWAGMPHHFPLRNDVLAATLAGASRRRTGGRDLARILGFTPGLVLVVLGTPTDGYCCKEVVTLLPAGRG